MRAHTDDCGLLIRRLVSSSPKQTQKLDVIANEVFCQAVSDSGRTALLVSEEQDTPIALEATAGGNYL